jgi:hypothetical protein
MSSLETQNSLRLAFGVQNGPKDAPAKLLRMIESEQQAIAVSVAYSGFKLAYIGACLGKSESYVSLLRAGKRPMPEKLVGPFCAATGTNLLRQFRDLQAALSECDARREVERLASMLEVA